MSLSELPAGCYRLAVLPAGGETVVRGTLRGTLRVDRTDDMIISGDLYRFAPPAPPGGWQPGPDGEPPGSRGRLGIPVYPRDRYESYLVAKGLTGDGRLTMDQYDYTPPPVGAFDGSFPDKPSREVTVELAGRRAPGRRWPGPYFEGRWLVGGDERGTAALGWVSPYFRRCAVEVDTVAGAAAPRPVRGRSGRGRENLRTIMETAGWYADVRYDRRPVPGARRAGREWTRAELHELMGRVRDRDTDLDAEWRVHVLAAHGRRDGDRGMMYDAIEVPREAVVVYSEATYPRDESGSFGSAAGRRQRQVPRAYLRSAAHELVHAFSMIHQEDDGDPDNSIMTSTPVVAEVLAARAEVFPDDIDLSISAQTRHRLVHFPDPVVRPGGHANQSWWSRPVPSVGPLP